MSLTRYDPVETIMNSGPRMELGMNCIGRTNQTDVTPAMGQAGAVNPARARGMRPSAGWTLAYFISRLAFLYPRHIPRKSDHGFRPSGKALSHKALVFFGRCR
ncbi:hypothetical protein MESS4_560113 [Mesorhizobium sp. STM 4661]|nr:hypothetical protein MESS4_560113 [Mesorhizobium sp. STM 4661]